MLRDLRIAARTLRNNATFTVAVTLALGLAIGSTGAIFSLVDGLWLRPLAVRDPGQIVWLFSTTPAESSGIWSYPQYEALRDRTSSFSGVAALGRRGVTSADAAGNAELLLVNVVTANFFTTLGVNALHGRLFGPQDGGWLADEPGVVLGYTYWSRRFGGDPAVVGRTIDIGRGPSRVPLKVLAVLPRSFRELAPDADRDLWMSPRAWARIGGSEELSQPDFRWFDVIARIRDGVTPEAAAPEVASVAAALADSSPAGVRRGARVVSDSKFRLEQGGSNAAGLLALVLLVVGITCVNVANLLLARSADRARELALRVAIGANRRQILRHLWAESALLGLAGGIASLLVAMWLIRLLPSLLVAPPGFRAFTIFEVDARVVAFTAGVTAMTTLLFSLAPILAAARTDVATLLRSGPIPASGGRGHGRVGSRLVILQVAISMVLVSSAAVLGRSFMETRRAALGFGRHPVLTLWVAPADVSRSTLAAAVGRLAAQPGVDGVAVAIRAPLSLSGGGMARPVFVPGESEQAEGSLPEVKYNAVSANYFSVMDARVREGRPFTTADEAGEPVALVNERFAATFFPGRSALGGIIRVGGRGAPDRRIVGIVENSVINAIGEPVEPYFYLPFRADEHGELTFLLASRGEMSAGLGRLAGSTLKAIDPRLEPRRTIAMSEYIAFSASSYQATAALAVALAAIGLVMTAIGVYGVIAYRTSRRAKEIGIRIALGAAQGQVIGMVLRDGIRVGAIGLAIGVPAALAATSLLRSLLFGVGPWDGPAFAIGAAALCLAVALATLLPALRAARLTPSRALREG